MGGAERNARKKRQAQQTTRGSSAVAAARRSDNDRKKIVVGVVVVVVLLVAVVGGVLIYNSQKNTTEGQDIKALAPSTAQQVDNEAPVTREGGVVVVGQPDAEVTLDVYEDFLCPACAAFEERYGAEIDEHVADGTVRVRYHMLPMLNDRSDPAGYSLDSANAGLCAADAGAFPAFHKSLFADQPEEGSRGWDRQQLAKLGAELGIDSADFEKCVTSGEHNSLVEANYAEVAKAEYLQQEYPDGSKGFGTPTLAVGEQIVDTSNPKWLDELVN